MLLQAMITKMETEFPTLDYSVNQDSRSISIRSAYPEIGNIDIQDHYDELTIFVGNFTYWHAGCTVKNLSEPQMAEQITQDVIDFLHDLFNDNIVMWGSHLHGGGFYINGERPTSHTWLGADHQEWLWSGPLTR